MRPWEKVDRIADILWVLGAAVWATLILSIVWEIVN